VNNQPRLPTYKGRRIGIVILTTVQLLIGGIHMFFGALLLAFEDFNFIRATISYDIYTIVFGILVTGFAFLIWQGKMAGWLGTISISVFVSIVDTLTLLDLPSIPGIPKAPAFAEIAYSLIIIFYLSRKNIMQHFGLKM
jgi:hypothetical protein